MAYYTPLYIKKYETGLVQSRQNFILPADAYPVLTNAYLWRERILRKNGYRLLGRLRRILTAQALGNLDGSGNFSGNIRVILSLESTGEIEVGSLVITDGTNTFTDNGLGVLSGFPGGSGDVNYSTMAITITGGVAGAAITANLNYFPGLPVMGLRSRELSNINSEQTIAFDTVYAYRYLGGWQEFIPGTTWTGSDSNFFWSTNYWVGAGNLKIFWVTNFSGPSGDPIRYTNGLVWVDFAPQIDSAGNVLAQCLAMLPFRGRMLTFNTFEGANLAASVQQRQRIRWSAIGNPFSVVSAAVATVNANAWRDDIPGQGGFLDIPTAEDIVSVGFVRDNLVIYCERSTWQLRYTGRSIAPFQIEKVNTELGAESTFSAVQFDTSLVGIGDKGVVSCDSYQSTRIDVKIPDLVFRFNNETDGTKRVHGIRDFQQRLAYWTYPASETRARYPNRRLVYNYEDDSWAIFTDNFTCLGTFQPQSSLKWQDFPNDGNPDNQWENLKFPWQNEAALFPAIIGGNHQGFIHYLGQENFQAQVSNDIALYIQNIVGNTPTPTLVVSPNHNLQSDQIIEILNIPSGTPFSSLNGMVFMVSVVDVNSFYLLKFNSTTKKFDDPQLDAPATYIGSGSITIRDNFDITSKKFNFLDDGQNIQFGFMDILMNDTDNGEITMNVLVDYNDSEPVNVYPDNQTDSTINPDVFFNSVIPTYSQVDRGSSKNWQRIYCNARGAFITLQFTFSDEQMSGDPYQEEVEIDAQILWMRPAGRQLAQGV
jgi:hypothetical protein